MNMSPKRSVGLKIIGFLFILVSLAGYLSIFIALPPTYPPHFQLYIIIWDTVFLFAGIGILNLKRWSRKLALFLIIIKSIQMFIGSLKDTVKLFKISAGPIVISLAIIATFLILVIGVCLIHYLTRPTIIDQFQE
jgi:hypothetical protein